MKKFVGLFELEHRHYATFYYVIAGLVLMTVFLGPLALHYFYPHITVEIFRLGGVLFVASILFALVIGKLIASFNREVKVKEIWLHNSSSIYTLVGSKILFHAVALTVLEAVAFVGLFFVGDLIEGTVLEYSVLALMSFVLAIMIYALAVIFIFVFYVLNLQMARYVRKWSNVVMFIAILLFFKVFDWLPTITILKVGEIDMSKLNSYLPISPGNRDPMVKLFTNFYMLEEIVFSLILIVIYLATCKWFERVITR